MKDYRKVESNRSEQTYQRMHVLKSLKEDEIKGQVEELLASFIAQTMEYDELQKDESRIRFLKKLRNGFPAINVVDKKIRQQQVIEEERMYEKIKEIVKNQGIIYDRIIFYLGLLITYLKKQGNANSAFYEDIYDQLAKIKNHTFARSANFDAPKLLQVLSQFKKGVKISKNSAA